MRSRSATPPARPRCSPARWTSLPLRASGRRVLLALGQARARAGMPEAVAPLRELVEHGEEEEAIAAAATELGGMLFFAGRAAEGAAILRRAQERLPAVRAGARAARGRAAGRELHVGVRPPRGRSDDRQTARSGRSGARGAAGDDAGDAGDGRGDLSALGVEGDRPRAPRARGRPPPRAPPRRELGAAGAGRPGGLGRPGRCAARRRRDPGPGARPRCGADGRDGLIAAGDHRVAWRRSDGLLKPTRKRRSTSRQSCSAPSSRAWRCRQRCSPASIATRLPSRCAA